MNITTTKLIRAAGLSAVLAGMLYIVRQPIHPSDDVSAVTGSAWAIVGYMTLCMSVLGLVGVTGIYLRQVKETGLLGLIGYLMFGLWFVLLTAFTFAQTLILPPLAPEAPQFVDSFLGIFSGSGGEISLGALGAMSLVSAVLYIPGGLLLGIAIFRARILSRWGAALLVVGMVITPLASVFPHTAGSIFAVPVGLALIWLGYSLWSEERKSTAFPVTSMRSPQPDQTAAA
ncbi:hypothetical protein QFZ79_003363 [Arthrobacter sp. V4I6]|uniref:hypothetical protein n=1 Tax=unclassified Arthrobacter TaxID=235627 RepID=UPI00277FE054|nr:MULTISPECIES: hypothetical protein [unclassified Arthrobacter]MDQ0820991.1 hypothetical protein [Arthrobacter sp. V1I7]MDQ0855252.1 hypothetical protein [Arthrobacter sp. V4I6]